MDKILTQVQLDELRSKLLPLIQEYGHDKFTCDECGYRYKCPLVFDAYNTGGDCIMEK